MPDIDIITLDAMSDLLLEWGESCGYCGWDDSGFKTIMGHFETLTRELEKTRRQLYDAGLPE